MAKIPPIEIIDVIAMKTGQNITGNSRKYNLPVKNSASAVFRLPIESKLFHVIKDSLENLITYPVLVL